MPPSHSSKSRFDSGGLLAFAEEDEVASQLRDEELKNAASQIRALSTAAHKGAAA